MAKNQVFTKQNEAVFSNLHCFVGTIEISFVTKTTVLGVFDFRAFLNIAMLLAESERARLLRQAILDIVIDTINQRTGRGIKYINQRDEDFLLASFHEESYRMVCHRQLFVA